jgi:DNA-binding PadR family transcriptional regulator
MPDRVRRNLAPAETSGVLKMAGLRSAGRRHIFAMYRGDTSHRGNDADQKGTGRLSDIHESSPGAAPRRTGGKRSGVLELAVLGLLHENPMHGYELRKQLNFLLGTFRALSYGSLYPCLKDLLLRGLIAEESPEEPRPLSGRSKIVYRVSTEGKERLQDLLSEAGPDSWEDDGFGVHFALFGLTRADVRLRILEGRRTRLEERRERVRAALARTRERVDSYTLELQRHGMESVEREVRWLNELIASERNSSPETGPPADPGTNPQT